MADACHEAGLNYEIQPGEGAFYGPKLEFKLYDCLGREWQCGTIQADFQLPSAERLDATYIGSDNKAHHPVMLHRAILGSIERFLGILIENFAGAFPTWLAFEQVAVVPVSENYVDYAKKVKQSNGTAATLTTATMVSASACSLSRHDQTAISSDAARP